MENLVLHPSHLRLHENCCFGIKTLGLFINAALLQFNRYLLQNFYLNVMYEIVYLKNCQMQPFVTILIA